MPPENLALMNQALRHRSAGGRHNERLEFLGDAILNFVVAAELYARRPDACEGELSRLRALLVKEDSLARIARALHLGDYLQLGAGELKSGGFRRASILADALEAVIGACYLHAGFEAAAVLIRNLFADALAHLPDAETLKDPKTRLQEYLQARQRPLPVYEVCDISGAAHHQTFTVLCRVEGIDTPGQGVGSSRRKAEQAAAQTLLERLLEKP